MKLNLYILFFILFGFKIQAQTLTPFTWQYPKYGGHALNCTRWINAQKFIAVGDAGTINLSSDDGATWQRVQPFTIVDFKGIFVKDSLTLFIAGSLGNGKGEIYKTVDGGEDLTNVSNISGELNTVWFLNSDTGYVGRSSSFSMYKTSNGGLTWSQVFGYGGTGCYTIKFLNDTLGYAGAYNSRIYRTTNAGLSWAQQTTFQTNEEISAIDFSD